MVDENVERLNSRIEENRNQQSGDEDDEEVENADDIFYEPLVHLPEIDVKTLEEGLFI